MPALKDRVELHEAKKGTAGPFSQIKDTFNAPADEQASKVARKSAARPFR